MKVNQPVATNLVLKGTKRSPSIPLEFMEGSSMQYKLCNIPCEDNSPVHELSVPYFGTGMGEKWWKFLNTIVGQHYHRTYQVHCSGQSLDRFKDS